jgi:hypothetical protein
VPGYHDNALEFWPLYPRAIRRLFTRSFTTGLNDPEARVRESEWRAAFAALRDQILYCACGQESFYCAETHCEEGGVGVCWSCGSLLVLPARLRLGNRLVILNQDTRLYPHHLNAGRQYDFSAPAAAMVENPGRPGQWGLRNLTQRSWAISSSYAAGHLDPGRTVALSANIRIDFGGTAGEILL